MQQNMLNDLAKAMKCAASSASSCTHTSRCWGDIGKMEPAVQQSGLARFGGHRTHTCSCTEQGSPALSAPTTS